MKMSGRKSRWKSDSDRVLIPVLLVALVLPVCAGISCSGTGAGDRPVEEKRGCTDILDIPDPDERQLALLRRHLQMPREICPLVYLARGHIEAGRLDEARLYLNAAADEWEDNPGRACIPCLRSGRYLLASLDFMDGKYASALDHLAAVESIKGVEEDSSGGCDEGNALNGREKFLKARVYTAMNKQSGKAAGLLLELWRDNREILNEAGTVMLVHLLLEQGMDTKAAEILMVCLSQAPYSAGSAGLWAELCRQAALPEYMELTLAEFSIIEEVDAEMVSAAEVPGGSTGAESPAPDSAGIEGSPVEPLRAEKIAELVRNGQWSTLRTCLEQREEVKGHRFFKYLTILCMINGKGMEPELLAEYQEAGSPYRGTQLYYSYLWKAVHSLGSRYRVLCEDALNACIQAGPHSSQALEARRQLAVFYGIPDDTALLPLTAGEMEELAGFVLEGAPPRILLPLAGFLEWPENRCSLHASLILRRLREIPGVRKLLREKVKHSNQRGKERIEAILSM